MTTIERDAKITSIISIINGMKIGETKRFRSGAEVLCDSYTWYGYSVISPDGDTSKNGISKAEAIELVIGDYNYN